MTEEAKGEEIKLPDLSSPAEKIYAYLVDHYFNQEELKRFLAARRDEGRNNWGETIESLTMFLKGNLYYQFFEKQWQHEADEEIWEGKRGFKQAFYQTTANTFASLGAKMNLKLLEFKFKRKRGQALSKKEKRQQGEYQKILNQAKLLNSYFSEVFNREA